MQKTNTRRLIYKIRHKYLTLNNFVILAAFLIAISWVWGALQMMERNYNLQASLDDKQRQVQLLELDAATAQLQQRYYQTDEYLELAARERLGLVMPGERQIILPPNSQEIIKTDEELSRAVVNEPVPVGNFEQWMNFLFGGNARRLGN